MTTAWQGTEYIERRLNKTMNELSYVVVPSAGAPLTLKECVTRVEAAVELYDWLAAQKPPRGVKRWAEHQLSMLKGRIDRASKKLSEMAE